MQKDVLKIISIALVFLLCFSFPQIKNIKSSSNTVYVDIENQQGPWYGTKQSPFKAIQDGINQVTEKGTVYVSEGSYFGNIIIDKSISLLGKDKRNTTIDGIGENNCILVNADNNTILGFTITNATIGINISNSSNSTFTENTIIGMDYGIYISSNSDNNLFYSNNFLKNSIHAYDIAVNTWYDVLPVGGNYWDDYNGVDINNDGIGDEPYNILGKSNNDIYPLMKPLTQQPTVNFSYSPLNPTTKDSVQFTDMSKDPDGFIAKWFWNFGDLNTSNLQNPQHKYRDNGVYVISLTVTDNYGVSSTRVKQINISNVPPTSDFSYNPENPSDLDTIYFSDKSQDYDGEVVYWFWDFGDGNSSNEKNPNHNYMDNGTFVVTLNITDDDGAKQTKIQEINVENVAPIALFIYEPDTPTTNDTIKFNDLSRDKDGSILSWYWDFGDGHESNEKSFKHKYQSEGTYTVSLTVVDNDGDYHTINKFVTVFSASASQGGLSSMVVYIIYLILFIIMIGLVLYLKRKYQEK